MHNSKMFELSYFTAVVPFCDIITPLCNYPDGSEIFYSYKHVDSLDFIF